jgi:hypothetical protein
MLRASYICSKDNLEADAFSRLAPYENDWMLNKDIFLLICNSLGKPDIDL